MLFRSPKDQKAVQIAANTMRPNPDFDMVTSLTSLAPGEALVSVLDVNGIPSVTQRIWIKVPCSRIGADLSTARFLPIKNHRPMLNRTNLELINTVADTFTGQLAEISPRELLMLGINRTLRWLLSKNS